MRTITGAAVLGTVLAAVLAACSGSWTSPAAAKKAVPTVSAGGGLPTASPTGATDPEVRAALAAYRESWADFAAVADSGNYQQARLGDHMAGKLLLDSSQNLFLSEQRGMISRGAPELLHPRVTAERPAANPSVITITDCIDTRNFLLYYKATGKPIDSDPGGLETATTQMTLAGGVWKASSEYLGAEGSCSG